MSILSDILTTLDRWEEWKRMRDAPGRIDELEQRLAALEAKAPKTAGENCKACGEPAVRRTASVPDPIFGAVGGRRETWTCSACGEAEERLSE